MSELAERFETHDPGEKQVAEKIRCDACPVMCYIADGRTGACDRYGNVGGRIVRMDPLTILDHATGAALLRVRSLRAALAGLVLGEPAAGGVLGRLAARLVLLALAHRLAVHQQAFLEKGRATHHEVDAFHQPAHVILADVFAYRIHVDERIELPQALGRLRDARPSDAGVRHEQLPVEVVGPEVARMGQHQAADTRRRELVQQFSDTFASPFVAASQRLVDDIIEPAQTRAHVADALAAMATKRDWRPQKKHGLIPL